MVYVEQIIVKGNKYYKLVQTIRKGDKIVHKSRYIGKIEKKRLGYKKEIENLSSIEREKNLNEFVIRFTYNSSKIAGVDVTLRQAYLILKEGVIPDNIKSLKNVKALENHQKCFMAITKYKGVLNFNFIKKLHKILFTGVNDEIAGKLRSELKM